MTLQRWWRRPACWNFVNPPLYWNYVKQNISDCFQTKRFCGVVRIRCVCGGMLKIGFSTALRTRAFPSLLGDAFFGIAFLVMFGHGTCCSRFHCTSERSAGYFRIFHCVFGIVFSCCGKCDLSSQRLIQVKGRFF